MAGILRPEVLTAWSGLRPAGANRWLLPQLAAITPQYVENVLRGALAGDHFRQWELFALMEDTWPRLGKNLNKLKNAVRNMKATFMPYTEGSEPATESAKRKCDLVEAAWKAMRPDAAADENAEDGTIYDLLDAWGKGVSVLEIVWQPVEGVKLGTYWAPRATAWVHPVNYGYDLSGRLGLRNPITGAAGAYGIPSGATYQTNPIQVGPFPENKFLIATRKHSTGSPLGGAMLRALCWWWMAMNFSADWLLNFAQIYGLPFRLANYDPNAPQATIDAICNMLAGMGSNGWAAFPTGTTLDFKEASKGSDHSPQADIVDRADKNCDLIVLGQTLTSDVGHGRGGGGGSRALGQVHEGVESEIVDSCARFACGILNTQLFPAILRVNHGEDSECPSIKLETEKEEDLVKKSEIIQQLSSAGAGRAIPLSYINDTFNIPVPQGGEPTLEDAAKPVNGGEGGAEGEPSGDAEEMQAKLKQILREKDNAALEAKLRAFGEELMAAEKVAKSPYGFCPKCGAPGVTRERRPNGDDRCANGCTYPSRSALQQSIKK